VFTDRERRRLRAWLETGEEGDAEMHLFVEVRRNLAGLTGDVRLLAAVARGLRAEGRLMGRGRFGSARSSRREELGSTRMERGRSTSDASSP
jgi:hypothetical protein